MANPAQMVITQSHILFDETDKNNTALSVIKAHIRYYVILQKHHTDLLLPSD